MKHMHTAVPEAIFEFGRGFYGDTDISVLSDLTLTPTVWHAHCMPLHADLLHTHITWKLL